MSKYKYILFDVAGTLLYKPTFYTTFISVLKENGYNIEETELKAVHKLLSEVIHFPDRTNQEFYKHFNSELLYALGIIPTKKIIDNIFKSCSYLPWEKFDDTRILQEIDIPIGIISNFNSTLRQKLASFFGSVFKDVLVSEELGVSKPDKVFYDKAIECIGVDPHKILYVGDSVKLDIEPALNIGIQSLLIDRDGVFPSSKHRVNSLDEVLKYIYG